MAITTLDIDIAEKFYGFKRVEKVCGEGEFFKAGTQRTIWYNKDGIQVAVKDQDKIYNLNSYSFGGIKQWATYDAEALDLLKDAVIKFPKYVFIVNFIPEETIIKYNIAVGMLRGDVTEESTSFAEAVCKVILRMLTILETGKLDISWY